MVNLITAYCSLLHRFMKIAGVKPYTVEIEPGTVMRFWVPCDTVSKKKLVSKPNKPVVVLLHGFCGDGIINWQLQVASLTKEYAVYVPDFLFFGGSVTDKPDRSVEFQAECVAVGLRKFGVEKCVVVGFSYGGFVAFKMAEMYNELVEGIVISGSAVAIMESIVSKTVEEAGFGSCSEMLLPTSEEELKTLLSAGVHRNFWIPKRLLRDFLQAMYSNRKERGELLEALVLSYKDVNIPILQQRIHLLWGGNDKIFKLELVEKMKEKLGNKTTSKIIKRAGHLVHLERPCVYNSSLKQFLSSLLPAAKN